MQWAVCVCVFYCFAKRELNALRYAICIHWCDLEWCAPLSLSTVPSIASLWFLLWFSRFSIRLSFAVFLRRLFFRIVKRSNAVNNKNKYMAANAHCQHQPKISTTGHRICVVVLIVPPKVKLCRSYEFRARVFVCVRVCVWGFAAHCMRREKSRMEKNAK